MILFPNLDKPVSTSFAKSWYVFIRLLAITSRRDCFGRLVRSSQNFQQKYVLRKEKQSSKGAAGRLYWLKFLKRIGSIIWKAE